MLTLTIPHDPDDSLAELLNGLQAAWRRLIRTPLWKAVSGGIRICEIKHGDNGWHPHLHCILDCKWLDHAILQREWERITGGGKQVRVERIRTDDKCAAYVSKYLCKSTDLPSLATWAEYVATIHGRRLMATFGDWSHISLSKVETNMEDYDATIDDGWTDAGSLATILARRKSGDMLAAAILAQLMPDLYPMPAPPIPPPEQGVLIL
jgi:hypothetical protein